MSILVVGSIAFDDVETSYGTATDSLGGSALYFSAAASLFSPVKIIGVVGEDFDLNELTIFKEKRVNVDGVYVDEGRTFRWGGKYHHNPNIRDTLYTHLNVFENFKPSVPEDYRSSEYVFLANIDPALQLDVLNQIENPTLIILDTMNYWIDQKPEKLKEVIKLCDILILNNEESEQLSGEDNMIRAGKKILTMGPKYLIIKKGEHGVFMISRSSYFVTPAYPVERVVDPTGAGDSFAGGLVGFLAQNKNHSEQNIRKAVVYGNIIASFNVEEFSFKRLINLDRSDIEKRMKEFKLLIEY